MSVTGRTSIGVPVVLMHEGEGCLLTIETLSGHVYRGNCVEAEDNMNTQLKDVTVTDPATGKESFVAQVYLRGTQILYVIFPEIIKHAPMFKRVDNAKHGKHVQGGMAFGRTRAIRSKVEQKARAADRASAPARGAGGAGAGGGGVGMPPWGAAPRGAPMMGMRPGMGAPGMARGPPPMMMPPQGPGGAGFPPPRRY